MVAPAAAPLRQAGGLLCQPLPLPQQPPSTCRQEGHGGAAVHQACALPLRRGYPPPSSSATLRSDSSAGCTSSRRATVAGRAACALLCELPRRLVHRPESHNSWDWHRRRGTGARAELSETRSGAESRKSSGYHPLEELSKPDRRNKAVRATEHVLSSAELARTIAEVNAEGIIFNSVVPEDVTVLGTDVNFLVADNGDVFFELDDDEEFLHNLETSQNCTLLVNFGKWDDVMMSDFIEEVDGVGWIEVVDDEDSDSDSSGDYDDDSGNLLYEDSEMWEAMLPGGVESFYDSITPEAMGSLGGWGGPETLNWVHPMEFATRLAHVAEHDYAKEIDNPCLRLSISGIVRKVTADEEEYVRELWDDRFIAPDTDDEESSDVEEADSIPKPSNSSVAPSDDSDRQANSDMEQEEAGTSPKGVVRNGVWMGELISGRAQRGKGWAPGENLRRRTRNALGVGPKEDKMQGSTAESSGVAEVVEGLSGVKGLIERARQAVGLGTDQQQPDRSSCSEVEDQACSSGEASAADTAKSASQVEVEVPEGDYVVDVGEDGSATFTWMPATAKKSLEDLLRSNKGKVLAVEGGEFVFAAETEDLDGDKIWEEFGEGVGASFYKLEILTIQLDSVSGIQHTIDVADFCSASPDLMAHASGSIAEVVNTHKRREMAALCLREKDLQVEEVWMVGVDRYGLDIRVREGIEIRTLRFPFRRPATNERQAEQMIQDMLHPRKAGIRQRRRGPLRPTRLTDRSLVACCAMITAWSSGAGSGGGGGLGLRTSCPGARAAVESIARPATTAAGRAPAQRELLLVAASAGFDDKCRPSTTFARAQALKCRRRQPCANLEHLAFRCAANAGGSNGSSDDGATGSQTGEEAEDDEAPAGAATPAATPGPRDGRHQATPISSSDAGAQAGQPDGGPDMQVLAQRIQVVQAQERLDAEATRRNWRVGNCRHRVAATLGDWVRKLRFSGDVVACGTFGGTVFTFSLSTGQKLGRYKGHGSEITALDFDGSRLVAGSEASAFLLWDTTRSNGRSDAGTSFSGHTRGVTSLQLDGNLVFSSSEDGTVRVWQADIGECLYTLQVGYPVRCLHKSGPALALGLANGTVVIYSLSGQKLLRTFQGHALPVVCVQLDQEQSRLCTGSLDATVRLWDTRSGDCLVVFRGHTAPIVSLQFDGDKLVTASRDGSVRVWDVGTGESWYSIWGHTAYIGSAQFDVSQLVIDGTNNGAPSCSLAPATTSVTEGQRFASPTYRTTPSTP
eukprot:SM000086S23037  [mRNA]  locus=s86:220846:229992:+ [translate_table: standard]